LNINKESIRSNSVLKIKDPKTIKSS